MLLWPLLLNWGHENIILGWTPKWCLVGPQLSAGGGGCARHDALATRDLLQKRGLHYKNEVGVRAREPRFTYEKFELLEAALHPVFV